jgi:hypothetical protein
VASPTGTPFYEYDDFGRQTLVATRGVGFPPANSQDYQTDIRYSYDILNRLAKVEAFEKTTCLWRSIRILMAINQKPKPMPTRSTAV